MTNTRCYRIFAAGRTISLFQTSPDRAEDVANQNVGSGWTIHEYRDHRAYRAGRPLAVWSDPSATAVLAAE